MQVTIRNFIILNGKPVEFSKLTDEEKKKISEQLNTVSAKQIGYERTA